MVKRLESELEIDERGRRVGHMTVEAFETKLSAVLGYGWKTRFAAGTGIATSTISRYMSGRYPIPLYVAVIVRMLHRNAELGLTLHEGFEQPADLDTTRWPQAAKLPPAIQRTAPDAESELYNGDPWLEGGFGPDTES